MIEVRIWEHKETKKRVRVLPWWECLDPLADEKLADLCEGRMFKIGALVQIGWLLENEHGMWLGVGPKAAESFNDLGVWEKEEVKSADVTNPEADHGKV